MQKPGQWKAVWPVSGPDFPGRCWGAVGRLASGGAMGSGLSVANLLFSVAFQHQLGFFARLDLTSRLSGQHERQQLGCERRV